MRSQLGPSGYVLVAAALLGAGVLAATNRAEVGGKLVVWTFDRSSAESFPVEVDGVAVDVRRVPVRLLDVRMTALSLSGTKGTSPADVVETEISSVGKYFRGAGIESDAVGVDADVNAWLPLDKYLGAADNAADHSADHTAGHLGSGAVPAWWRDIPESRRALWRDPQGRQRLLPRDLHPTTLTYLPELFSEVGLDPTEPRTWAELAELGRRYDQLRKDLGQTAYRSIEWPRNNASVVLLVLQQRGVRLFAASGRPDFSDPRIAETLAAYASWVTSAGAEPARSLELTAADLSSGKLAMLPTPDWRAGLIERAAPELAGRVRMRPLPVFSMSESNAPTASWGGTGIGIPAGAKRPDESWRLIDALYSDRERLVDRYVATRILPVVPSVWEDPRVTGPEAYYGGQAVGALLSALARELPPMQVSPLYTAVQMELNGVTSAVVRAYESGGESAAMETAGRLLQAAGRRLDERWHAIGGEGWGGAR